jgi:hypothetical protein
MNRRFAFILPILSGLFLSQLISSWVVYQSNLQYYQMLNTVHQAGYLIVPNLHVMERLKLYSSAFNGGLFFTLTTGLFITMLSMATAWIWHGLWQRQKKILLFPLLLAGGALWSSNQNGLSLLITLYLLLIPPIVFGISCKGLSRMQTKPHGKGFFVRLLLFSLFIATVAYQTNTNVFLSIRDNLLLTTTWGQRLNLFYYENSLYAARIFKSNEQKLFNTCVLSQNKDSKPTVNASIRRQLLQHDYLPIPENPAVEIKVQVEGQQIKFGYKDNWLVTADVHQFLQNPKKWIALFGDLTDKHTFFRQITMISLLVTCATILYLLLFLPFFTLIRRCCSRDLAASFITGILCIILGTAATYFLATDTVVPIEQLESYLSSPITSQRIGALKSIYNKKIPITRFSDYRKRVESPNVAERYWLAKALGTTHGPDTHEALLRLLDDEHFNVVCMAFFSLGQQRHVADIPLIQNRIKQSKNWYEQWYAYKALRKIGWQQNL